MRTNVLSLLLLLCPCLGNAQIFYEDTNLDLNFTSEGFFYNSEFSHPVKPGYTLPGITLRPFATLELKNKVAFTAGYFATYIQGKEKEGLLLSRPLFTLSAHLFGDSGVYCALGTLPRICLFPSVRLVT